MTYEDPRLVTPDEVEDLAVQVLRDRHAEHLAAHERRRGLAPETLQRLQTIAHYAGGDALSGDTLPAVLIGAPGLADVPARNEDDALDVGHLLTVEVIVLGQSRRDTLRRRDWTAWTVVECLLQRLPRSGEIVSAVQLRDVESVEEAQAQRVRARARMTFAVTVPSAVSLLGLPADDDERWAPGAAGGPPPEGLPYDLPLAPPVVVSAEPEVVRVDPLGTVEAPAPEPGPEPDPEPEPEPEDD